MTYRLITIPMSHYCEKARWALERLGIPYVEDRHMQGFHYPWAYFHGGGPFVPVLVTPEKAIVDSTVIMKFLDTKAPPGGVLYPEDAGQRLEVETLEDRYDEVLGVESRRWIYVNYVNRKEEFIAVASQGVPAFERWLFGMMFPVGRAFARKRLHLSLENVKTGKVRILEILAEVEARLADGRRYLMGDTFTAADLTFASLAAPLVMPPEYGIRLPSLEELTPEMARDVVEYRNTAAGRFASRLFATSRSERVA